MDNPLQGLQIVSQNVNSLNLSTKNFTGSRLNRCNQKILALLHTKADFLLLQDVRVSNNSNYVTKMFSCSQFGNYNVHINSTRTSRGVMIAYKCNMDIKILSEYYSQCQNIILLEVLLGGKRILVGSVYGPRQSDNPSFYEQLKTKLDSYGVTTFIIGGDHNAIPDTSDPPNNLDVTNCFNIPNPVHSRKINYFINDGAWVDAFRILYPDKKEYSFTPFAAEDRLYRSRLDFFLCNFELTSQIKEIEYPPLLSKLFDHKPCLVKFKEKKSSPAPIRIDNALMDIPGIQQACRVEALEVLNDHLVDRNIINEGLIQRAKELLLLHKNLYAQIIRYYPNDTLLNTIAVNYLCQIDTILTLIGDAEILFGCPLNVDEDLFLHVLVNNLTLKIVEVQKWHKLNKNISIHLLEKELTAEKRKVTQDLVRIAEIEKQLTYINEKIISDRLKNLPTWDILQNERSSRIFCNLNAKSKKSSDLRNVKIPNQDPDQPPPSEEALKAHIASFYKGIYSVNPDVQPNIPQFLGEISNSELANSKKLTNEEKNLLDRPLNIHELDEFVLKVKKKSAPGADGFSYQSVKKLWHIFRVPVLRGFKKMVEKGNLTYLFARTNVKLIGKKDDPTKIENYRPISLLSTFYKIVSGVLTNRLNTVVEKITSIVQKGFSREKNIMEIIIKVSNYLNVCKQEKIDALLMCVDFKKAFDSVNFDYILECLKFFNVGETFIGYIRTLLSGRKGNILFEGATGPEFDFNQGSPQGDIVSPILFIICIEPLLMRLQLDPDLEKITTRLGKIVDPAIGYADDLTLFFKNTLENIARISDIFSNFYSISGLKLNERKTIIVPIGSASNDPDTEDMVNNNTNFVFAKNFTLLGVKFDNLLANPEVNHADVLTKVSDIINFWNRFNISLIGRINIYKTFLLSQVAHKLTGLDIDNAFCKNFDNICEKFIKGKEKVGKQKIFGDQNKGGLGIPYVQDFITCLKVNLLLKKRNRIDDWLQIIYESRTDPRDEFSFSADYLDLQHYASSLSMVQAFQKFEYSFFSSENNTENFPVFRKNNKFFFIQNRGDITPQIFSQENRILLAEEISGFKAKNFFVAGTTEIKDFTSMNRLFGDRLTINEYFNLRRISSNYRTEHREKIGKEYTCLSKIISRKNVGSKKYRQFFSTECINQRGHNSRLAAVNLAAGGNKKREFNLFKTIHTSFIPTYTRSRFLNILNNTYLYNGQLCKLDPTVYPGCRFCEFYTTRPHNKEVLTHVANCINFHNILAEISGLRAPDTLIRTDEILLGSDSERAHIRVVVNSIICLAWNEIVHLRKITVIGLRRAKSNIENTLSAMRNVSSTFNQFCTIVRLTHPNWQLLNDTSPLPIIHPPLH